LGPPAKAGEPPVVRCRHHVGFVLETVYEDDPEKPGQKRVRVVARPPSAVPPPPKAAPPAKTPPAGKTPAAKSKAAATTAPAAAGGETTAGGAAP
jgi:hypothetical protein